ncbi:solute carrier family 25 member 35-like [Cylas formicarius]|uniref:solute carrier family 25 member 35-like n=1 Tax=Cylas formicarius TaxID=197179 RepID=UPI002958D4A5|nr:solute carrier family 25 member 35-like [Cylas formicarius]
MDFVIGGMAACGASVFSNPLDVLKTRMQLQGELKARGKHALVYRNVFHAAYVVAKNEGLGGLQKGLGVAMFLHGSRNSIRLGTYQYLNRRGFLTDANGKVVFHKCALGSAFSGGLGAFCASPLFLIKTQIQSQAAEGIAVGHQHSHRNAVAAIGAIYSRDGIKGLWRGANATVLRALVGSSVQLTSFAMFKDSLRELQIFQANPLLTSLVSSLVSGAFQTIAMNPFDVVSTRLYNQGVNSQGKGLLYDGLLDCFFKIWQTEGVYGFYKGTIANYMRLGPHSVVILVLWDVLKDLQNRYLDAQDI